MGAAVAEAAAVAVNRIVAHTHQVSEGEAAEAAGLLAVRAEDEGATPEELWKGTGEERI